ncbi:MAG: PDZ domain-containing protein [Planctomycetia bacterium]|nr:PDZ domain-containing protein [Planctomycetia bacterium]
MRSFFSSHPFFRFTVFGLFVTVTSLVLLCHSALYAQNSEIQEVFRSVADRISPCVVRIETTGGNERIGQFFTLPETTGVILTADGWIISSSVGFAHQPDAIFITLADGTRHLANLIMTDRNRKLSLLKINLPENALPLPVPVTAPKKSFRVGQWTLTLGRVLDAESPSMTLGVLSATNRIWGKAIQTDAAVSLNNYGGPLVDMEGRVMGILTPFSMDMAGGNPQKNPSSPETPPGPSPQIPGMPAQEPSKPVTPAEEAIQGIDLYDSGIGFAIPLEDIYHLLPRMQEGKLELAAPLGVSFGKEVPIFALAVIQNVQKDSTAEKAGFKTGDKILTVNDVPVQTAAEVRHQLFPLYAGDQIKFKILQNKETLEISVILDVLK